MLGAKVLGRLPCMWRAQAASPLGVCTQRAPRRSLSVRAMSVRSQEGRSLNVVSRLCTATPPPPPPVAPPECKGTLLRVLLDGSSARLPQRACRRWWAGERPGWRARGSCCVRGTLRRCSRRAATLGACGTIAMKWRTTRSARAANMCTAACIQSEQKRGTTPPAAPPPAAAAAAASMCPPASPPTPCHPAPCLQPAHQPAPGGDGVCRVPF